MIKQVQLGDGYVTIRSDVLPYVTDQIARRGLNLDTASLWISQIFVEPRLSRAEVRSMIADWPQSYFDTLIKEWEAMRTR